ncbi:MAG: hypothetical protein OXQ30_04685 [Boseongicola sp.]|nr:hypothetical protein [Boseongicola sp.]
MSPQNAKEAFRTYTEAYQLGSGTNPSTAIRSFFAEDAQINVVHPFNRLDGAQSYKDDFYSKLAHSFEHLQRNDYIAFAGEFEGATWVTSTGYYSGHFVRPFLTIQPTHALAYLRFGEFHRMEHGRAVESFVFLDIPELMIACGCWPIEDSPGRDRGYTGYLPGPATEDGTLWNTSDPDRSLSSYELVTSMLRKLATKDEEWRPYWHEDMVWYGPAAFGSFVGIENFAGFQVPFEQTFSEWIGGAAHGSRTKHFTRFADGDYICSGGWPSLNAKQSSTFLGQPSKGKRLYMRVCDWWRRSEDRLVENWVFVDIPHVLLQMGLDIFPNHHEGVESVLEDLKEF